MNTIKKIKIAAFVLVASLLAVSCLPENQSIGDTGTTFVRLSPDNYNMLAFDAKPVLQTGIMFEVRRDVVNDADLNGASTVTLQYDTDGAIMAKYNKDNGTSYIPLPTSLGTTTPAVTNGTITLNFGAGDFAKSITINIPNAGNFDFSKSYALAFKIASVSGVGKLSAAVGTTVLCELLAKNRWDGVYTVTGTFTDYIVGAPWTGAYPLTVQLRTTGANTCSRYDADNGFYFYLFDTTGSGGYSYFGAFTPAFEFDPATNKVVRAFNTTTDSPARGRTAVLYTGDGAINKFDPVTKSLNVGFYLKQLNVSPQLRTLIMEQYKYKGPR